VDVFASWVVEVLLGYLLALMLSVGGIVLLAITGYSAARWSMIMALGHLRACVYIVLGSYETKLQDHRTKYR
jgi:hypothetical protein